MDTNFIKRTLSYCLLYVVISGAVGAQINETFLSQNACTNEKTCDDCIRVPSCAWCFDPNYIGKPRCFLPVNSTANGECEEEYVLYPSNIISIIKNLALSVPTDPDFGNSIAASASFGHSYGQSAGNGTGTRQVVQLAPQRVNLKLRPHAPYRVFLRYRNTKDYSLDLYYLMDLSRSMKDDVESISRLGTSLVETMKNLTSDFRIGFGSFVDKPVMPYISTIPQNLIQPCTDCAPPYDYKHVMALTTDTFRFSEEIKRANFSGNLDNPEGGLDGLMQVAVCQKQIGWRDEAKKIIVLSTDSHFHVAGDGKLGGIVEPNDGNCHIDENGAYTKSTTQDYPSIRQVKLALKRNSINTVFAVTENVLETYTELANSIDGASVAKIQGDSSNIVELLVDQYRKLSSTIELKHNASSSVKINIFSSCDNGRFVRSNKCSGVKIGDTITFALDIEVINCPEDLDDYFETIEVYPIGIKQSLIIKLEMICGCTREGYQANSTASSKHGTHKRSTDENVADLSFLDIVEDCINSNSSIECSGRGECIRGRCWCQPRSNENEVIYGKYCECDNFSCQRHNGIPCNGHGMCDCGICVCQPNWNGSDCSVNEDII